MLHATEPVPPLPAGVPADLAALVMRLLAKEPAQRPADANALLTALSALGQPVSVINVTTPDAPQRSEVPAPVQTPLNPAGYGRRRAWEGPRCWSCWRS